MSGPDQLAAAFDVLCPMHVVLDRTGHMRHVGPTLGKLRPDRPLIGGRFLERFEPLRPAGLASMADLRAVAGQKLRLRLRDLPRTLLSAVLMPLPEEEAIVAFGFGHGIVDAVRAYTLTHADFAVTDLAVEMLFMYEAKSALVEKLGDMSRHLHGARQAAQEQAMTDPVTGLRNRRALQASLGQMIGSGQEFALMHLDLDHFKQVNDSLGHAAGDHVLAEVAQILVQETRAEDTVARIGGDEFVVAFDRLCDRPALDEIAGRIIARMQRPIPWQDRLCRISASAGTAVSDDYRQPEAEAMMADADAALYAAKRAGRGRHVFHRPQQAEQSSEEGGVERMS